MDRFLKFLFIFNFSLVSCHGCQPEEFECQSGLCIPYQWLCDGANDCPDGEDETGPCPTLPPCGEDEFRCNNGKCIPAWWACDRYPDCKDGEDEIGCVCDDDEFSCEGGYCIPNRWVCDGEEDCSEGEDEEICLDSPFVPKILRGKKVALHKKHRKFHPAVGARKVYELNSH